LPVDIQSGDIPVTQSRQFYRGEAGTATDVKDAWFIHRRKYPEGFSRILGKILTYQVFFPLKY
jgi:hypothetical protein